MLTLTWLAIGECPSRCTGTHIEDLQWHSADCAHGHQLLQVGLHCSTLCKDLVKHGTRALQHILQVEQANTS